MHCILPILALYVVTLSWTINPNHLAQLTYIVSNHCYEKNPFLDPVFYSRCHLPFTLLTGKKKGTQHSLTSLISWCISIRLPPLLLYWNYSYEHWKWLLNVKYYALFLVLILCVIFFRSLICRYADTFLFLLTTAPLPRLLAPLLSLPQTQVFPCSAFSSNSPLLLCYIHLHRYAYLHGCLASMSVLTILSF